MSDSDTPYIEMLEAKVCRLAKENEFHVEKVKALLVSIDAALAKAEPSLR